MSANKTPFTEYAKKTDNSGNPARAAWITACVLAGGLIAALLFFARAQSKLQGLEPLPAKLEEASAKLSEALADAEKARDQIIALESKVATLEKEKEEVGQTAKGLESEMRSELESKDVTISKLQGKLTVNILDRVLFDSGEAILKTDGETVLRKIASILDGHRELRIQVNGHTDNLPIRTRFASNWELSTARALAAVHFLTEKAGVDPLRVGAAGYGEFRPIADNATAEGRARNRRIVITLLPEELAAADAIPGGKLTPPNDPHAVTAPPAPTDK